MKYLIGVTGSVAAYKAVSIVRGLLKVHPTNEVKVIMTESAKKFITPLSLQLACKDQVYDDELWWSKVDVLHIELANWCDKFVVVPATANTIAKLSNGIADNFLTATALALNNNVNKYIIPSMNTNMLHNHNTQHNISNLKLFSDYKVIDPDEGMLACGVEGEGKLPKTKDIIDRLIGDYVL